MGLTNPLTILTTYLCGAHDSADFVSPFDALTMEDEYPVWSIPPSSICPAATIRVTYAVLVAVLVCLAEHRVRTLVPGQHQLRTAWLQCAGNACNVRLVYWHPVGHMRVLLICMTIEALSSMVQSECLRRRRTDTVKVICGSMLSLCPGVSKSKSDAGPSMLPRLAYGMSTTALLHI